MSINQNTGIKTTDLPLGAAIQGTDTMLVNTETGAGQVPFSAAGEFFKNELKPTMQEEAADQISTQESAEKGSVTITNNQAYPFNVGTATVALATPRKNLDYITNVEIAAAVGNVQAIEVYDKQLNGFKIRYDGSATSVTIKYYVTGGMQ